MYPKKYCKVIPTVYKNYGAHLFVGTGLGARKYLGLWVQFIWSSISRTYELAGMVSYCETFEASFIDHYTACGNILDESILNWHCWQYIENVICRHAKSLKIYINKRGGGTEMTRFCFCPSINFIVALKILRFKIRRC